jgi:hypothetical protein
MLGKGTCACDWTSVVEELCIATSNRVCCDKCTLSLAAEKLV